MSEESGRMAGALGFFGLKRRSTALDLNEFSWGDLSGHGIFLAWIFLIYWSPAFVAGGIYGSSEMAQLRVAMCISYVLTLLLMWACAKPLSLRFGNRVLAVMILLTGSVNILSAITGAGPYAPAWLSWTIIAVAQTALTALWSRRLAALKHTEALAVATWSFIMAGALYLLVSYLQTMPSLIVTGCLPFISLACFVVEYRRRSVSGAQEAPTAAEACEDGGRDGHPDEGASEDVHEARTHQIVRRSIFMLIYSIALGFTEAYATSSSFIVLGPVFIGVFSCLAGIAMGLMSSTLRISLGQVLSNLVIPAIVVCLIPLLFFDQIAANLISIGVLFFLFGCLDILGLSSIPLEVGDRFMFARCAKGRLFSAVGVLVGWLCGYYVIYAAADARSAAVVFFFIIVAAILLANIFTIQNIAIRSDAVTFDDEGSTYSEFADDVLGTSDAEAHPEAGWFKRKCEVLAERYELSPRQKDVFMMLAKGRDVDHIQEALYVSRHTVKSHIYAIYRKMDVHSQQELMDLVDGYKLDE